MPFRAQKLFGTFEKQATVSFGFISGGHNSHYVFATPSFSAIILRNSVGFPYNKNMLKDHLFKTSRLKFDNCPFGPEKFSGLSRNSPTFPSDLVAPSVEQRER